MHSVRPLKSTGNKWTTGRTLICGNRTCRRYTLLHLQIITGALLRPAVREIVFLDVRLLQKEECTKLFHLFIDGLALLEAFPFAASLPLHSLFFWLVNPLDFLPECKEAESNRFPCGASSKLGSQSEVFHCFSLFSGNEATRLNAEQFAPEGPAGALLFRAS